MCRSNVESPDQNIRFTNIGVWKKGRSFLPNAPWFMVHEVYPMFSLKICRPESEFRIFWHYLFQTGILLVQKSVYFERFLQFVPFWNISRLNLKIFFLFSRF